MTVRLRISAGDAGERGTPAPSSPTASSFYAAVFAAIEQERHTDPGGRIVHAELRIGGVRVALKEKGDGDPAPISRTVAAAGWPIRSVTSGY